VAGSICHWTVFLGCDDNIGSKSFFLFVFRGDEGEEEEEENSRLELSLSLIRKGGFKDCEDGSTEVVVGGEEVEMEDVLSNKSECCCFRLLLLLLLLFAISLSSLAERTGLAAVTTISKSMPWRPRTRG